MSIAVVDDQRNEGTITAAKVNKLDFQVLGDGTSQIIAQLNVKGAGVKTYDAESLDQAKADYAKAVKDLAADKPIDLTADGILASKQPSGTKAKPEIKIENEDAPTSE